MTLNEQKKINLIEKNKSNHNHRHKFVFMKSYPGWICKYCDVKPK